MDYDKLRKLDKRLDNEYTKEAIDRVLSHGHLDEDDLERGLFDFGHVMQSREGYSSADYIQAVAFCTHKIMGDTQISAYKKVFPERVAGKSTGAIAGKASIYSHGKLVNKIMGFAQVPTHLIYMRERHKAIRKLADLIDTGVTDRIQMESADKLLNHIKPPEEVKIELDIGVGSEEVLGNISESLDKLAALALHKLDTKELNAKTLIQR